MTSQRTLPRHLLRDVTRNRGVTMQGRSYSDELSLQILIVFAKPGYRSEDITIINTVLLDKYRAIEYGQHSAI